MKYELKNYERILLKLVENNLFKGKVIILYGARRAGKTIMCEEILKKYPNSKYINCELMQNKDALETTNDTKLKDFFGDNKLIVLDEAQKIKDIGLVLKIITDTFPDIQIIATGSSSFELANKTGEALTGRARRYLLYPLSIQEIKQRYNAVDLDAKMENILRFGMYPSVFDRSEQEMRDELNEIASNYLYKDLFQFSGVRKPDVLVDLLKALALQIGNEVSLTELANKLEKNSHIVETYLNILEQSFIVFKVRSFSRNLRKEIGKKYKIYFYDLGIRNSLIQNFNPINIRDDIGALWENFCLSERMKNNNNNQLLSNYYFWRTYNGQEIDWVEERDGKLFAYEMKWGKKIPSVPSAWRENYLNSEFKVINRDNYLEFIS